jgi:hypothetical protein
MKQISQTILMVRPENFGYNTETAVNNAFQQIQTESSEIVNKKAQEEFDALLKNYNL